MVRSEALECGRAADGPRLAGLGEDQTARPQATVLALCERLLLPRTLSREPLLDWPSPAGAHDNVARPNPHARLSSHPRVDRRGATSRMCATPESHHHPPAVQACVAPLGRFPPILSSLPTVPTWSEGENGALPGPRLPFPWGHQPTQSHSPWQVARPRLQPPLGPL